ncbi:MAG: serine/threonine-protein kinase [Polyangiaceae bacterium]
MTIASPEIDAFLGRAIASEGQPGVRFTLERRLGIGGTAAAFLASRMTREGQSPAVVKIILPEVAASHGSTAAMVVRKEAVALGRLNERVPPTPFVVRLMDTGTIPHNFRGKAIELPWLAIEFVDGGIEGTTLEERVANTLSLTAKAFDRERAARAISHVCAGLADVHAVGVIHRDLTPNNILCCGFGDSELFKLSDFGIARPAGVSDTFGPSVIGTPGYISPEHLTEAATTSAGDIFALGCLIYFILTGDHLFDVNNALEMLSRTQQAKRRSIRESPTLAPELAQDGEACATIDAMIARATAADPTRRPENPREISAVLAPLLLERKNSGSRRERATLMSAGQAGSLSRVSCMVRHPPGDERILRSVGWDGDGHCLAASTRGLEYWNGSEWAVTPTRDLPVGQDVRFVRRVAPGRWLLGGNGALLAEYSHSGVSRVMRGRDADANFLDASGNVADLAAVVSMRASGSIELCAAVGGRWLRPLPLPDAAYVSGLTQIDEERWLVVGRSVHGGGFVLLYSPLSWTAEPIAAPATRAWVACTARSERDVVLAVGTEGTVLRMERGLIDGRTIAERPNLASVSVDVLDREWAGGIGELWCSVAGADWARVWQDPAWNRPFVSLFADVSTVTAMSVDGGVLECRPGLPGDGSWRPA